MSLNYGFLSIPPEILKAEPVHSQISSMSQKNINDLFKLNHLRIKVFTAGITSTAPSLG